MLVNISMKFHEDILSGLKVIERTQFCHKNRYLQSSKGHTSKNLYPIVMVLALCTSPVNGFQVTERTRFCH